MLPAVFNIHWVRSHSISLQMEEWTSGTLSMQQIKESNISMHATKLGPLPSKQQHSVRLRATPWLRTSPPQTLDPRESPIISEDMKLGNPPRPAMLRKEALFNDAPLKTQNESNFLPHYQELPSACYSVQSPPSQPLHGCKFLLWCAHTWLHWCVRRQVSQVPRIQNELELHFKQYIPAVCVNI